MKRFTSTITFLLVLLVASCKTDPSGTNKARPFFNFQAYFLNEVALLKKNNVVLTKTVINENSSETLVINEVDWLTELQSFIAVDINKPALLSAYRTDSLQNGTRTLIQYKAKDTSPQIRNIVIKQNLNIPDTIIITRIMSNTYVSSTEIMYYYGNGNFEINVENNPVAGKKIAFVLKGVAGKI
ncbi:MAG: hypothetical protein IPP71_06885 [Bacteroidetes bacterium]|nr:hypothetical protein [Bacteroidota bacterium]